MDDKARAYVGGVLFGEALAAKRIMEAEGAPRDKLVNLAGNAMEFANRVISEALRGNQVACKQGCAHCCHLFVAATAPEVLRVAAHVLETYTPAQLEALRQRLDEHAAALSGVTRYDDRMLTRLPCPLLNNSECSVYAVRPVTCRGFHSMDVEQCRADHERPSELCTVTVNGLAVRSAAAVSMGLQVGLRHARLDHRDLDFARALRIALADPTLIDTWDRRPGAFDAAALDNVYPDGQGRHSSEREGQDVYRKITNRPEWTR